MSQYKDATHVEGFGTELILFKRADLASEYWWFRANIPGSRGYIRRSTKETEIVLAKRVAATSYHQLMGQQSAGLKLGKRKIYEIIKLWFDYLEQNKLKQPQRLKYIRSTWERYMSGYFGHHYISNITDDIVEGYWTYRKGFYSWGEGSKRLEVNERRFGSKSKSSNNINPQPKFGTLKAEASIINEFFKWCAKDGQGYTAKAFHITAVDATSKQERMLSNRRPTFSRDEWRRISTNLYYYSQNQGKMKGARVNSWHLKRREMFRAFILLLSSTGLRVGEARALKWRNIKFRFDVVKQRDVLEVQVEASTSKVSAARTSIGFSELISNVMRQWKETSEYTEPDELVFYNVKKEVQTEVNISATWKAFLQQQNLWKNADGENRPLYSLRHLYATMRLEEGTEIYHLAKLMGTAVRNIEQHYGHVATESLIAEATKGGARKDRQEARDLREAAELIRLYRQGDITAEQVTKKITSIGEVGKT